MAFVELFLSLAQTGLSFLGVLMLGVSASVGLFGH